MCVLCVCVWGGGGGVPQYQVSWYCICDAQHSFIEKGFKKTENSGTECGVTVIFIYAIHKVFFSSDAAMTGMTLNSLQWPVLCNDAVRGNYDPVRTEPMLLRRQTTACSLQ